jgi:hypothetical protein
MTKFAHIFHPHRPDPTLDLPSSDHSLHKMVENRIHFVKTANMVRFEQMTCIQSKKLYLFEQFITTICKEELDELW